MDMVFSNAVYVSPSEFPLIHAPHVQVKNGMIWKLQSDPSVPEHHIAFNKLQRDVSNLKLDQSVSVVPFTGPIPPLGALRLQVESLNPKCAVTMDETTLIQGIQSLLADHIFSRGQVFCVEFRSVLMKISVLDLIVNGTAFGTHGAIHEQTVITCTARAPRAIRTVRS